MDADIWQIIEALSTLGAALLAGWALWQAKSLFSQQQKLSQQIHEQQIALSQRQLFIPIFEQFKGMAAIDSQNPVWVDVVNAVNFLELLGICWEGELVDRKILLRLFREYVIETYESIQQCKSPPSGKDGETMLKDSRAATSLYKYLMSEHFNRDLPEPLR